MNWDALKSELKDYGQEIGIDKMGFTDAQPLTEHLPRLLARQREGYKFSINEGDPEKRIFPHFHLPQAKSIISIAIAYRWIDKIPDSAEPARGRISLISRGEDYHIVVRDKLEKLKTFILKKVPAARTEMLVDTGEILEKAIAVKAGLGWFGRNTLLITSELGSWVTLGELLTDLPLPADKPDRGSCGSCSRCVDACPTNAIGEEGNLNLDRCLACVTLSKALIPEEIRYLMGNTLYGCDICQSVCPHNQKVEGKLHNGEYESLDEAYPVLVEIIRLTNAEYKKRFGNTSGAWRGKTPLQRNAVIAAGNLKDIAAIPELLKILFDDQRPVLRAVAAWALGNIGTDQGRAALAKAASIEQDKTVIKEINLAIKNKEKAAN